MHDYPLTSKPPNDHTRKMAEHQHAFYNSDLSAIDEQKIFYEKRSNNISHLQINMSIESPPLKVASNKEHLASTNHWQRIHYIVVTVGN